MVDVVLDGNLRRDRLHRAEVVAVPVRRDQMIDLGEPGVFDRGEDIRVGATTADVAAHEFANFVVAVRVIFFQQRNRGANLAGRAIAALKSIVLDERGLHRMQFIAIGQPFDRRDLVALVHECEGETRIDPSAIHQNRARAALPVIAAFF